MWEVMRIAELEISTALSIIDDALCHSFEFKVENGAVWFRQI